MTCVNHNAFSSVKDEVELELEVKKAKEEEPKSFFSQNYLHSLAHCYLLF